MRCSRLRHRFRPRKTGHFRSCITRSRLEQTTKIVSFASPAQHQRCSVRDLCDAQLVTRIGRNSSSCVVERPPAQFQDSANSPPQIHLTSLAAILDRGKTARNFLNGDQFLSRSEERRVGKESGCYWVAK